MDCVHFSIQSVTYQNKKKTKINYSCERTFHFDQQTFFRIWPNNGVIILAAHLIAVLIQREIMTCDY